MKKYTLFICFFILCVASNQLLAQSVDLLLSPKKQCDEKEYCLTLKVKSNEPMLGIQLGTASLLMTYNQAALSFRHYFSKNLNEKSCSGAWDMHDYDAVSHPGQFNLTLSLLDESNSCPVIMPGQSIEVGKICFGIVQQGANPEIAFDANLTQINSDQPNNGTAPVFINDMEAINGLNLLVCDCPGEGSPCDDQNVYTTNDQFDVSCNCQGEYLDLDEDGILDGVDDCLDQSYQAENATLNEVQVRNNHPQYEGLGFVDYQHGSGDWVEFTVMAAQAGNHVMAFRYALSSGTRTLELQVDNQVVNAGLPFPETGSWGTWGEVSDEFYFTAGLHTVRLSTIGSNGPNLDQLVFSICSGCTQAGMPCDDGLVCTTDDVYDTDCNCHGVYLDTDADGVCDVEDTCPLGDDNDDDDSDGIPDACDPCDNNLVGTACDDGDPCTMNDVYNNDCECAGTFFGDDEDGDGVCDDIDVCEGGDDNLDEDGDGIPDDCDTCNENLIGTPCDDGNVCTILDVYISGCDCDGLYIDSDSDGVCNILDQCEGHDDNLDIDSDGIPDACDDCDNLNTPGTPCDDGDLCTINDVYDAECNCVGVFEDTDNDSVCDYFDRCEGYDDLADADADAIPNACDNCDDVVYQAEDAVYSGVLFKNWADYYSGSGFLDYRNSTGDSITFTVEPAQAGVYLVSVRYASWSNSRKLEVQLDGNVIIPELFFPNTNNWSKWEFVSFWVELDNPSHDLLLRTNGHHGPNIDHLSICHQVLDPITIDFTNQNVSCHSGEDGMSTASANGGTGNYTYAWSNGQSGAEAIELVAGTYSVTATDDLANTATATVTITEPDVLALALTAPTMEQLFDGSIDLTVSGGTAPFAYAWSNGSTVEDPQNLLSDNYKVTVTDANGCSATGGITVSPELIMEAGTVVEVGENWQTITLEEEYISPVVIATPLLLSSADAPVVTRVKNATGNSFDLKIQNPGGTVSATYIVRYVVIESGVFDDSGSGIKMEAQKVLSVQTADKFNWVREQRTYKNEYSSPVVVGQVMTANDPAWSVFWSSRHNSQYYPPQDDGFAAGKHVGHDSNINRANETIGYLVMEPGMYTINGWPIEIGIGADIVEGPDANGTGDTYDLIMTTANGAVASASGMDGGDGGWPILFGSNPISGNALTLAFDEDQIGDSERGHTTEEVSYIAFEETIQQLLTTATFKNALCAGGATGEATAEFTGGIPPVTYLWSNGAAGEKATDLAAGSYTVTATDAWGTTATATVAVGEPPALVPSTTVVDASCFGGTNGSASVTSAGGTGDVDFVWGDGSTTASIAGLTAGTYSVTATDDHGCTATADAVVGEGPEIVLTFSTTPETNADGAIDLTVSGGVPGYSFNWSNGSTSEDLSDLPEGIYGVTVTDANSCTASGSVTVHPVPKMEAGTLANVSETWQTVTLNQSYNSMVVAATPVLPAASGGNEADPVVTRIKNAAGNSFDIRVQNPGGTTTDTYSIHFMVVEEGVYNTSDHGINMEAQKVTAASTASYSSWTREVRTYQNTYTSPVVLGQVMTYNDTAWSTFWASRNNSQSTPPLASGFAAGKHVGQDANQVRANETIGCIVFESGNYAIDELSFEIGLGSDIVKGTQNTSAGYQYNLNMADAQGAVLSAAAMDGGDGGWPVLYGSVPVDGDKILLAFDEDQILDSERSHTTEQVAYFAFHNVVPPQYLAAESQQVEVFQGGQTLKQSFKDTERPSLMLYPNPVSDQLSVKVEMVAETPALLEIIDLHGRIIQVVKNIDLQSGSFKDELDVNDLAPGVYMLKLTAGKETMFEQFVKVE
ncbi:MAG: carbohydrate-binding protein [Bacteroidota bacterium]